MIWELAIFGQILFRLVNRGLCMILKIFKATRWVMVKKIDEEMETDG